MRHRMRRRCFKSRCDRSRWTRCLHGKICGPSLRGPRLRRGRRRSRQFLPPGRIVGGGWRNTRGRRLRKRLGRLQSARREDDLQLVRGLIGLGRVIEVPSGGADQQPIRQRCLTAEQAAALHGLAAKCLGSEALAVVHKADNEFRRLAINNQ